MALFCRKSCLFFFDAQDCSCLNRPTLSRNGSRAVGTAINSTDTNVGIDPVSTEKPHLDSLDRHFLDLLRLLVGRVFFAPVLMGTLGATLEALVSRGW